MNGEVRERMVWSWNWELRKLNLGPQSCTLLCEDVLPYFVIELALCVGVVCQGHPHGLWERDFVSVTLRVMKREGKSAYRQKVVGLIAMRTQFARLFTHGVDKKPGC